MRVTIYRGEYTQVVELTLASLAALPADRVHDFFDGSQPLSVNSYFRLLASLAQLGRFAEAAEHESEIIRLAEGTQHPYAIGLAYHAVSLPHLVRGGWARAHRLMERQLAAWRAGGMVQEIPITLAYSARALAYLGQAAESLSRLQEAERLLAERADEGRTGYGTTYASLGRAALRLGRLDDAQRFADRAVASVSGRGDFVPATLHLLGDLASHPDRFDAARAESHYRASLALAEPRGMRPLVAHCHLGLGMLGARRDRPHEAREHLATAAAMYREMGMEFWLEEANIAPRCIRRRGVRP